MKSLFNWFSSLFESRCIKEEYPIIEDFGIIRHLTEKIDNDEEETLGI